MHTALTLELGSVLKTAVLSCGKLLSMKFHTGFPSAFGAVALDNSTSKKNFLGETSNGPVKSLHSPIVKIDAKKIIPISTRDFISTKVKI